MSRFVLTLQGQCPKAPPPPSRDPRAPHRPGALSLGPRTSLFAWTAGAGVSPPGPFCRPPEKFTSPRACPPLSDRDYLFPPDPGDFVDPVLLWTSGV